MSSTPPNRRSKKRYALLLLIFLLGILALLLLVRGLATDSTTSESSAPMTTAATPAATVSSEIVTAPGIPELEAYAMGSSIGWQVTANPDNGGSEYTGYEIELLSTEKDVRADFPGNGSGAGMYSWTFDGDPTLMARTHTKAGLHSDWVAMVLPVAETFEAADLAPSTKPSAAAPQASASPRPSASRSRRAMPASIIGENAKSIIPVVSLPAVLITAGRPGVPMLPSDMPTPTTTSSAIPVDSISPSASGSPTASPSGTPTTDTSETPTPSASPSGGDSTCTDGNKGKDRCRGEGSGDHPKEHRDDEDFHDGSKKTGSEHGGEHKSSSS